MDNFEISNKWIFLVPIDGITNRNISKNITELSNDKEIEKENIHIEDNELSNINFIEKNSNIQNNKEQKDLKAITYSFISKTKNIPKADSSKIYMSEFLKKNWKIRIKRIQLKLKKRYSKQSQRIYSEDNENTIKESSEINNNININNLGENYKKYISNINSINFGDKEKVNDQNPKNNYYQANYTSNNCNLNINNLNISNNEKNYYNYFIFDNNINNINNNNFNINK